MATQRIKNAFNKTVERIANKEPVIMGEIMRDAGYTESTSRRPDRLVKTNSWQELMAQIDDTKVLQRLYDIALDKNDKRATLQAVDMLLKLKDKYPDAKLRLGALEQRQQYLEVVEQREAETTPIKENNAQSVIGKE